MRLLWSQGSPEAASLPEEGDEGYRPDIYRQLPLQGQELRILGVEDDEITRRAPIPYDPINEYMLHSYLESLARVILSFLPDGTHLDMYEDGTPPVPPQGHIVVEVARSFVRTSETDERYEERRSSELRATGQDNILQWKTRWMRHPYLIIKEVLGRKALNARLQEYCLRFCQTRPSYLTWATKGKKEKEEGEQMMQSFLLPTPTTPNDVSQPFQPWTLIIRPIHLTNLWWPIPRALKLEETLSSLFTAKVLSALFLKE